MMLKHANCPKCGKVGGHISWLADKDKVFHEEPEPNNPWTDFSKEDIARCFQSCG
jgi:hypothetical protein